MKQDTMRKLAVKLGHVCPIEKLHLKTEITQRDKDHVSKIKVLITKAYFLL